MILTPKEEAKELVDTFYQTTPYETWIDEPLGEFTKTYTAWGQAKQCTLIAVDELIKIHLNILIHLIKKVIIFLATIQLPFVSFVVFFVISINFIKHASSASS